MLNCKGYNEKNGPKRDKDGRTDIDTYERSREFYGIAKEANERLMKFISDVLPNPRISVMYFDEAQELGLLFWVFLRLVQHQSLSVKMWYVFMGTESNVSFYSPNPSQSQFLTLCACTCLTRNSGGVTTQNGDISALTTLYQAWF